MSDVACCPENWHNQPIYALRCAMTCFDDGLEDESKKKIYDEKFLRFLSKELQAFEMVVDKVEEGVHFISVPSCEAELFKKVIKSFCTAAHLKLRMGSMLKSAFEFVFFFN